MAPPERSAQSQTASVLPCAPTVSSSRARIDREPEITTKAVASHEDKDSGDSNESGESDSSAKPSDGSGNSNFGSGHDSDGDHRAKNNAPPVRIGPPKSKPTKSVDVIPFVPDQGILFLFLI